MEGDGFSQKAIAAGPPDRLPVPMPAGSVQRTTLKVPWADQVFYYGISAADRAGNDGPVSNLVPVYVASPPQPTATSAAGGNSSELVFEVSYNLVTLFYSRG